MSDNVTVKYVDNKTIRKDTIDEALAKNAKSVNGCVEGPPCPDCHWSHGLQGCPSGDSGNGAYCTKPQHAPCP